MPDGVDDREPGAADPAGAAPRARRAERATSGARREKSIEDLLAQQVDVDRRIRQHDDADVPSFEERHVAATRATGAVLPHDRLPAVGPLDEPAEPEIRPSLDPQPRSPGLAQRAGQGESG